MKKLFAVMLLSMCGCGTEQVTDQYPLNTYQPSSVYAVKCYFWDKEPCGFTLWGCTNGVTFYCQSQADAFYKLVRQ